MPTISFSTFLRQLDRRSTPIFSSNEVLSPIRSVPPTLERAMNMRIQEGLLAWGRRNRDCVEAVRRILEAYNKKSEVLFLNDLGLSSLPEELWACTSLKELGLERNCLFTISSRVRELIQLKWLRLQDNRFEVLPAALYTLDAVVYVARNPLIPKAKEKLEQSPIRTSSCGNIRGVFDASYTNLSSISCKEENLTSISPVPFKK